MLNNMVEEEWLDAGKRQGLKFPIPQDPKPLNGVAGQKGYIVEAARKAVLEETGLSSDQFDLGGWTITVNIDRKKQQQLEKSVETKLIDNLDTKKRKLDQDIQAGAVSVDPKTGAVIALYGGRGQNQHWSSNAARTDYQPASTFKPVILAAALDGESVTQDGRDITANTRYDGTSERPVVGSDVAFAPENEDDRNYGSVTVQTAMNKSINSVFAQMGVDVGMDEVMKTAGKLGMDVEGLDAVPAQTLGSMGASPMAMAGVYATLDNHGKKVTPQIVKSAVHQGEDPVRMPDAIGGQVISRQAADSVTSVLTGVVDDGTARGSVRNAEGLADQQIAGKTGTSDYNRSAWFTGYTPDLVTSVGLFGEAAFNRTDDDGKKVHKGDQVTLKGMRRWRPRQRRRLPGPDLGGLHREGHGRTERVRARHRHGRRGHPAAGHQLTQRDHVALRRGLALRRTDHPGTDDHTARHDRAAGDHPMRPPRPGIRRRPRPPTRRPTRARRTAPDCRSTREATTGRRTTTR